MTTISRLLFSSSELFLDKKQGQKAGLPQLKQGQVVEAEVLEPLPGGRARLMIQGKEVFAKTFVPLKTGDTVLLQVSRTGARQVLKVIDARNGQLAELKQALAKAFGTKGPYVSLESALNSPDSQLEPQVKGMDLVHALSRITRLLSEVPNTGGAGPPEADAAQASPAKAGDSGQARTATRLLQLIRQIPDPSVFKGLDGPAAGAFAGKLEQLRTLIHANREEGQPDAAPQNASAANSSAAQKGATLAQIRTLVAQLGLKSTQTAQLQDLTGLGFAPHAKATKDLAQLLVKLQTLVQSPQGAPGIAATTIDAALDEAGGPLGKLPGNLTGAQPDGANRHEPGKALAAQFENFKAQVRALDLKGDPMAQLKALADAGLADPGQRGKALVRFLTDIKSQFSRLTLPARPEAAARHLLNIEAAGNLDQSRHLGRIVTELKNLLQGLEIQPNSADDLAQLAKLSLPQAKGSAKAAWLLSSLKHQTRGMALKSEVPDPVLMDRILEKSGLKWEAKLKSFVQNRPTPSAAEVNRLIEQDLKALALQSAALKAEDGGAHAHQIRSFVDGLEKLQVLNRSALEDAGRFFLPLPVMFDDEFKFGQMLIDLGQDPNKDRNPEDRLIRVAFLLDMSKLGPVQGRFSILHKGINGLFGVADDESREMILSHVPGLKDRLQAQGFEVYEIKCEVLSPEVLESACLVDEMLAHDQSTLNLVV